MRDVMRQDTIAAAAGADGRQRTALLRWMIAARLLDERMAVLYRQGQLNGKVFLGKGQEALSAALGMQLRQSAPDRVGDIFAPLIRDQAGRLAFGEEMVEVARVHFMRATSAMKGRDGNIHRGDVARGILPMISHLGAMVSVVAGMLLARKLKGTLGDTVGATCIGDGGMQTGALHEGINLAAVEKLPLVLVVADNQVSYSTFHDRSYACRSLVDRAIGYGIRGVEIDGTDGDACLRACSDAVARARAGEGPQMIVATLLRGSGHGEHDDAAYVSAELKARFGDCLALYEKKLVDAGLATEADLVAWRNEVTAQIRAAVQQAQGEPEPEAADTDWRRALASTDLRTRLMPRGADA